MLFLIECKVDKKLLETRHDCVVDRQLLHDFKLPVVDCSIPRGQCSTCCSVTDIQMWLGAVACGVEVRGDAPESDYVSTYRTPEPHTTCRYGTRVRWTGMVHSDWVWDLLCRARLAS